MKKGRLLLALVLVSGLAFTFNACESKTSHERQQTTTKDKSGFEYTAAYICPMHCEGSGSDEAGQCNICGMDYRVNKDKADQSGKNIQQEEYEE